MSRRLGAALALLGTVLTLGIGGYLFVADFPRGLILLGSGFAALSLAWYGLLRRGGRRWLAAALSLSLIVLALVVTISGANGLALIAVVVALVIGIVGGRIAFRPDRSLPRAPAPRHSVLFINPRSGGGRAGEVGLAAAAEKRGIEVVELSPGDELEELVRAAVGRGADGLAMAGGDGSQALVAAIAAELDLPYACIPSGTRNHFALDLGVDRKDVVGALDAFVDGGERYVDLAEVNGRVFVNNVSLGVYAQAVNQDDYRESKLRTLLDTLTETLGPEGETVELRWTDPDGSTQVSAALVLVSNNPYLLGPTLGTGTRPRLDRGLLGIVDFHPPSPGAGDQDARWRALAAAELEIEADGPIPLGIDGESLTLQPPLRFRVHRRALRARIARGHPGASPSADVPLGPLSLLKELLRVCVHGE
jgi:diacylglycerol kinase family enzyme